MKTIWNIEKLLVRKFRFKAGEELDSRVYSDIAEAMRKSGRHRATRAEPNLRRTILKGRTAGLAVVVAIVIAVLAGVYQIGGAGVALAEVLQRVEQTHAFMYKIKMTVTGRMGGDTRQGETEQQGTNIVSTDHGMKMEMTLTDPGSGERSFQQTYVLPEEKAMYMILRDEERYARMEFDDNLLARMKRRSNDPREMIKRILNCRYTELGPSAIDGVKVEGFRTTDPAFYGETMGENVEVSLWVDVETQFPVLARMDLQIDERTRVKGVIYDYQWNIPVDESEFEPLIPENYEPFLTADSVKVPSPSEEGAVEGLKLFAEFTGEYAEDIDTTTLMRQVDELRGSASAAADRFRKRLRWAGSEERRMETLIEVMRPVQALRMFYAMQMQNGNDPAYYGDQVTPEFPHAILMRWSIEHGNYRVIFGDLSVAEVTADELAELEAIPLNIKPTAVKPQPPNGGAVAEFADVKLSWMPGAHVNEHKVYFGAGMDKLAKLAEVIDSCSVTAPSLEKGTTYYWRVDEVQPDSSIAIGDLWSFNTGKLVGWWKFDGDADDSSGNGNHGTVNGDPKWVIGRVGGALHFDGIDDCVDTGYATDLPAWAIAVWVNSPAAPSSARSAVTGPPVHRENCFQINWNHSVSDFCGGAALRVGNKWYTASFGELEANRWYHLAATYDQENLKAYKDGVLITDNARPSGPPDSEWTSLKIGGHSIYKNDRFKGIIDDVRIYSYDLTSAEVGSIYASLTE
ncbi:MAG: LamG-like jellyroll fold domain-containing protein [Planctomycetota bacterium]|jgi:hypothetical protein